MTPLFDEQPLLIFHLFSLFFLTGLIWIVQVVHYPAFQFVSQEQFAGMHEFHSRRITWIVAPIMLLELGTGAALWWQSVDTWWLLNFGSVCLTWLSTGLVSVPIHTRLGVARQELLIKRLVTTNWIRTGVWTARAFIWLVILVRR